MIDLVAPSATIFCGSAVTFIFAGLNCLGRFISLNPTNANTIAPTPTAVAIIIQVEIPVCFGFEVGVKVGVAVGVEWGEGDGVCVGFIVGVGLTGVDVTVGVEVGDVGLLVGVGVGPGFTVTDAAEEFVVAPALSVICNMKFQVPASVEVVVENV